MEMGTLYLFKSNGETAQWFILTTLLGDRDEE
jgi:hypothetical protein